MGKTEPTPPMPTGHFSQVPSILPPSGFSIQGGRITKIVASPYYMLPEVLKHNYGPEINVWIVGVILYIVLCGVQTFLEDSEQGVAQAIMCSVVDFKRDPRPGVSEPAKDFVRQTLDPDPITRFTTTHVLSER
ncbi:hypothetical protein CFC21_001427 [Triticum aestivum]|uniref:Protein kinase domain-containing protein n=1 Tax=Triticum aestivum TaxID=4565 RepID=A0A3B5XYE6_WHEAT|nr:hypothetical protein CFC21_001427 [Triticum aestivum]